MQKHPSLRKFEETVFITSMKKEICLVQICLVRKKVQYKSGNWDLLVWFCEMWILADTFYATAYFEPSQRSVIYLLAVNYFCKRNPSWTLSKKCPYSELFWSAFSSIPTEYGEMRSISRYRVSHRIQSKCGKMRTRITPNTDTFYAVRCLNWS